MYTYLYNCRYNVRKLEQTLVVLGLVCVTRPTFVSAHASLPQLPCPYYSQVTVSEPVIGHGDLRVIPRVCKRNLGGSSWALGYGAQYFGCQEDLRRLYFLAESLVPGGMSHNCTGCQAYRFLRAKVLLMGFCTQKTACLGSSAIVRYALHKSMLAYIRKCSFFLIKKNICAAHAIFFWPSCVLDYGAQNAPNFFGGTTLIFLGKKEKN